MLRTIMYVDWELVALNTNPMFIAWILIFTEGGALMRTRQVWLELDVGFSKTPLGENSCTSQSIGQRHKVHFSSGKSQIIILSLEISLHTSYPDGGSFSRSLVTCRRVRPHCQVWADADAREGRWFWWSARYPLPSRTSSQMPGGQKMPQTPLQGQVTGIHLDFPLTE